MRRILVAFALLMVAGCSAPSTDASSTSTSNSTSAQVSKGLGTKDASADVRLASFTKVDHGYGIVDYKGLVEITNHSAQASDYYIEISILNKAGTNVGFTNAIAQHVNPGQKAQAEFISMDEGAAKAVIHQIQRTASA